MTTTTVTAITPLPLIASGDIVVASVSGHAKRGPPGQMLTLLLLQRQITNLAVQLYVFSHERTASGGSGQ